MNFHVSSETYCLIRNLLKDQGAVSRFVVARRALLTAYEAGREDGYRDGLSDADSARFLESREAA